MLTKARGEVKISGPWQRRFSPACELRASEDGKHRIDVNRSKRAGSAQFQIEQRGFFSHGDNGLS